MQPKSFFKENLHMNVVDFYAKKNMKRLGKCYNNDNYLWKLIWKLRTQLIYTTTWPRPPIWSGEVNFKTL